MPDGDVGADMGEKAWANLSVDSQRLHCLFNSCHLRRKGKRLTTYLVVVQHVALHSRLCPSTTQNQLYIPCIYPYCRMHPRQNLSYTPGHFFQLGQLNSTHSLRSSGYWCRLPRSPLNRLQLCFCEKMIPKQRIPHFIQR